MLGSIEFASLLANALLNERVEVRDATGRKKSAA